MKYTISMNPRPLQQLAQKEKAIGRLTFVKKVLRYIKRVLS